VPLSDVGEEDDDDGVDGGAVELPVSPQPARSRARMAAQGTRARRNDPPERPAMRRS
jgi:hypothetical protein